MKKPHYRLHCNFGDAKPLWWVSARVDRRGVLPFAEKGVCVYRKTTFGFSTPRAAIASAAHL